MSHEDADFLYDKPEDRVRNALLKSESKVRILRAALQKLLESKWEGGDFLTSTCRDALAETEL